MPLVLPLALALTAASLPDRDIRDSIQAARTIGSVHGAKLWPGYATAPFYLNLVERDREVLFCRSAVRGFKQIGVDPITGCALQTRERSAPVDSTSSLDLEGTPVIEIGEPAALGASRADWILTVAHEHFHLYQTSLPAWQAAVDRLGLSNGRTDASWMLGYPFPYARPDVGAAFAAMQSSAAAFLESRTASDARAAVERYVRDRRVAATAVGAADWAYYEFQVGSEGVARWTEIMLGTSAGKGDRQLAAAARDRREGLLTSLRSMTDQGLKMWKRSSFYVLGAIEAEMLERSGGRWRERYRQAPFSIGEQLYAAAAQQSGSTDE